MQINFSTKHKESWCEGGRFSGRVGHRVARINDSIFTVGGVDKDGNFINQVHRINCQNNRIDTLIVENMVSIEGFSMFCWQDSLYIWGGQGLGQHSNQLIQFDGCRFIPLKQSGTVPRPRANNAYATFGSKFLIIYGGNDQKLFFKDWYLLNLKTFEWRLLTADLQLDYSLKASMVWLNGRGVLMLNNSYDSQQRQIFSNLFYSFYVTDYNTGKLTVEKLHYQSYSYLNQYIFSNISVMDSNSILVYGGIKANSASESHNLSLILHIDTLKIQKGRLQYRQKQAFQSIFYKNKLFLIGGILATNELQNVIQVHQFSIEKLHFKRHVCANCRLYFDEQWVKSSKQVYSNNKIRQEHDYNYHFRLDNRVLSKFSSYIPNELQALTLIIDSLRYLTATRIYISLKKTTQELHKRIPEIQDQSYRYLKICCTINPAQIPLILDQILQIKDPLKSVNNRMNESSFNFELSVLRLKMGIMRIGKTSIISLRLNQQQICIIYFSYNQLQNTHTNLLPFTNFHYIINSKTRSVSSPLSRHIIFENTKNVMRSSDIYEEIGSSFMTVFVICDDELQNDLNLSQQNDGDTVQSWFQGNHKEDSKKVISSIQLAFLPIFSFPEIEIQQNSLHFINIYQLLESDCKNGIIENISQAKSQIQPFLYKKISLFNYSTEYCFKKVLVYHKGRMINQLKTSDKICGIIELCDSVELDLSASNLSSSIQQKSLLFLMKNYKSLKRHFQN